ncbi:chromatin structure-remodeling complex subunit Sfh1p [[Candida] anglica]|uniref:Chromatin structure-remodeling complex subunit Sfh1p n=1 Tax=[Candida] anglica TaxID=148631 RepID=A0ABP0EH52_9ASCO
MSLSYQPKSFLPQALATGLQARMSKDPSNALIVQTAPQGRQAKRHAQQINYAEFDNLNDDFDFEDTTNLNTTASSVTNSQMSANSQKFFLKSARRSRHPEGIDDEEKVKAIAVSTTSTSSNSMVVPTTGDSQIVNHPAGAAGSTSAAVLIPIRLDFEYNNGNSKLVDFFMWNLHETLLTPHQFATLLCGDLELPNHLQNEITESITKQIEDYSFASSLQLPSNKEYHVIIDLSVNLDKKLYQDKFEWNLAQNDVTPEQFADIVVADMGLSLEFKPAIAHSLHEVILRMKREILEGVYNHELHKYQQQSGLIFESGIRILTESSNHNGNDQWEPIVEVLTPWEIEKREIERERNIRRLKRENIRREVDDFSGGNKRRAGVGRRRHDELEVGWKNF